MTFPQRFALACLCAVGISAAALAAASSPPSKEDCDNYYLGIHGVPDLAKALRCYKAEQRWEMLIVMSLNGEGAPVSIPRAEELLLAWQREDPNQANSLQAMALSEIIDERRQHSDGSFPRVDFCRDIAQDTVAMNSCAALDCEIDEVRLETMLAKVKAGLTPVEAAALDKVVVGFKAFESAEGGRAYQRYIGGTGRIIAAIEQVGFVRDQFSTLTQNTVERRQLQPADRGAYEAADRELNQVYRDDIRTYTKDYEEQIKDDQYANGDRYRFFIEEYKKDSKDAQIHWIRYRDLCAELARLLYKGKKGEFDPALSMKTAVTRIRVLELRNDPMGPGDEEIR
ncbi:MAG: lysozyme inhibitor LprI family protein [Thermoanaerobaculia bacterium]